MESPCLNAEATSLKPAFWKQGVSKRGNLVHLFIWLHFDKTLGSPGARVPYGAEVISSSLKNT